MRSCGTCLNVRGTPSILAARLAAIGTSEARIGIRGGS
jgi:hypothetical protein